MRSATLFGYLAMAGLGSLLSCGSGTDDGNLLITVTNLSARITTLTLKASLNDGPAMSVQQVAPAVSKFGVVLPTNAMGHFVMSIQALDSDGCIQANGQIDTTVSGKYTELPVSLTTQTPRSCGPLMCPAGSICSYTPKPVTANLWSVWANSPLDVWAVGDAATALHYDGTTWVDTIVPVSAYYNGVWGSGANDVWAVGQQGAIIHYNGKIWSPFSVVSANDLTGVYGTSPTEVWASGTAATATAAGDFWRWDGLSWKRMPTGIAGSLLSVWASSPTDITASGASGLLIRYNGTAWSTVTTGTTSDLRSVWGISPTLVFAAGALGTVLRNDGIGWKKIPVVSYGSTLYGLGGDRNNIYGVGNANTSGNSIKGSAPFDTFSVQNTANQNDLTSVTVGANGIGWVVGRLGYIGYFDTRP